MIPTYTTSVGLPKICLTFDWPTQMKIPRTVPADVLPRLTADILTAVHFIRAVAAVVLVVAAELLWDAGARR